MANKRIAGITIEIGGDTTKLQTALKGVDKELSTTQRNLTEVNKLLKLDPSNVELLAQKQKNLQSAIDTTKERLETLKQAQTDALSPAEYDALQREIIETENNLKALETEYQNFGSVSAQQIQNVGNKVSEVGKKITTVGTNMTKYITTPIVGIGVAAAAAFAEVDKGIDTIIKKTGASGDDLEDMKQIMEEIATEIPTDFETAGNAIGEVNTRFGVTGQTLKDLSTQYIKFAQINNTDVTNAVDSTQKALAAYGLTADDASGYLDQLTKTSQQTGIDVGVLADGIVKNSTAFQEMGLSIDEATVFMGQLEMSGADANLVLAGMRKALKNAAKEGKPLDQVLSELQTSIDSGTTSTDGLTEAYKLFGTAGAQVYAAVKDGTLDFNNLATAADDASGTVSETFDATLDPADKFKTALNAVKVTAADIADTVMPAVASILEKVRDVVVKLKEKWDGLDKSTQENILKFAGLAAAAGPVVTVLGKIVTGGGSVITAIGKIVGAISAAGGIIPALGSLVTAAGPLLVGGAVVAGVVAAVVLIVKNWDKIKKAAAEIKQKVVKAWEDMKTGVSKAVDTLKTGLSKAWDSVKDTATKAATNVKNAVTKAWDATKNAVAKVMDSIKDKLSKGWTNIKTTLSTTVNNIKSTLTAKWESIKTTITDKTEKMKEALKNKWDSLKTNITDKTERLKETLKTKWDSLKTSITDKTEKLKETLKTKWDSLKTSITDKTERMKETLKTKWENMKTSITDKTERLKETLKTKWENLKTSVSSKFTSMTSSINTGWTKLKDNVAKLAESMKSTISTKWTSIKTAVTTAATNIKSSVTTAFTGLKNSVSTTWNNIKSAMTGPISSAKSTISTLLTSIKNSLANMKWSLPKLKMPHFSVEWKDVGGIIKLPKISVSWYRKAYEQAMMFSSPTVLPTASGLKGFGDGRGAEIVLSDKKLREIAGTGTTTVNITINAQNQSPTQIAAEVERVFVRMQRQKEAAYA